MVARGREPALISSLFPKTFSCKLELARLSLIDVGSIFFNYVYSVLVTHFLFEAMDLNITQSILVYFTENRISVKW